VKLYGWIDTPGHTTSENWVSRLVYGVLWAAYELRRKLGF
jgi:hypothetical protein